MADLRPTSLVVEDIPSGRVAVAGGEPDVPTADLAELRRPGPEQGPFELGELLLVVDVDRQV